MPLPPERDHRIPLAAAAGMTRRHRATLGAKSAADGEHGGMLPRAPVEALLAQKGCAGLRFYYARDDKDSPTLVVVGVDQDGNDMVSGDVLEWIVPCPPNCGEPSALNR